MPEHEDKEKEETLDEHEGEEKEQKYATDVFETPEEAEKRAEEMGGKGSHEMTIEINDEEVVMYMPFPTHPEYLQALEEEKKLDEHDGEEKELEEHEEEEKKASKMETLTDCDCEDKKGVCDCKEEVKQHELEQTFNIKGVEIFSTGVWNGDKYTHGDLEDMVTNFNKTGFQPPIKLGHNDEQPEMLDGEPALGYVNKIYVEGKKLLADFIELPQKIYEAIKRGNYKRVSSEIYWNYKSDGTVLDKVLKAVALLGSEIPAVTNLESIEGLYTKLGEYRAYYQNKESEIMEKVSVKEYEDLQNKLEALKKDYEKANNELVETKGQQRADKIRDLVALHKEAGRILPSFEKELVALLENSTEDKIYSYTLEEKTVELSQFDLVEKIIQSLPKLVEFAEISENGEFVIDRQPYSSAGDEVDRRANLYIEHGKADKYADALELVFKDDADLKAEYEQENK
ncbi:MAG: putative protease I [Prokaryotic dsDNA virus sp.]|nr:MAG: putative protease I [Prokaryotic dsDNA virus sp.]|tara:strand:- start:14741 stop:16108 length:1368 start_codon:yes stop_codon:yes gene_type:complete